VDETTALVAGGVGETFFVETLQRRIAFRVAAIAQRFPTVSDRFIVADVLHVAQQFNLAQPGFGTPTEAWLGRPADASDATVKLVRGAVMSAPLNQLVVDDQAAIARQLQKDPLRQMSVLVLLAAAFVGAVVCAIGLAISALSDVADQEQFRRTLRLDGISDRSIHRTVGWRTLLAAALAIPVGGIAGVLLVRMTAPALGAGASNAVDTLPLRYIAAFPPILLGLAVALVVFAVAAQLGSRIGSQDGSFGGSRIDDANLLRGRS
jgi:hypothetical protein